MSELPPERKPDEISVRDKAAEASPDMPGGSRTFFYARATGAPRRPARRNPTRISPMSKTLLSAPLATLEQGDDFIRRHSESLKGSARENRRRDAPLASDPTIALTLSRALFYSREQCF